MTADRPLHTEILPLIGVNACSQRLPEKHPFFIAGEKYVRSVAEGAGGLPLVIPALGKQLPIDQLIAQLDGLLLTGSPSNIEPHHYQGEPSDSESDHDPSRDATTLPLVRAAIAAGVPILGICRGFQEMNVALGGTLHQKVHDIIGYHDHREDKTSSITEQYNTLAHLIKIQQGGLLSRIWPETNEQWVNSLHGQGVRELAPGLQVEAVADDGLIEAFSVKSARQFALAVQWHPEWQWHPGEGVSEFPFYRAIFKAFGDACRVRQIQRLTHDQSA